MEGNHNDDKAAMLSPAELIETPATATEPPLTMPGDQNTTEWRRLIWYIK
jgi:hypothetical protein